MKRSTDETGGTATLERKAISDGEILADLIPEILGRGHDARFRAPGGSMHPTIRGGDVLNVSPVRGDDVSPFDIVLVNARRGLTAHRVVRVQRDGSVVTRGDAANSADEPVSRDRIVGRVTSLERDGIVLPLTGRGARIRQRIILLPNPIRRLFRGLRRRIAAPEDN